jgi:hypothetical protein
MVGAVFITSAFRVLPVCHDPEGGYKDCPHRLLSGDDVGNLFAARLRDGVGNSYNGRDEYRPYHHWFTRKDGNTAQSNP